MKTKAGFWIALLDNFPLTKSDREIVARFRADPEGIGFLSLFEVLKSCGFQAESLELLQVGVAKHARFTAARVVLAKEFWQCGMAVEALTVITESPTNLTTNILAKKIELKALLITGDESGFRQVLNFLTTENALDTECERLAQGYYIEGFTKARSAFAEELVRNGVPVSLSSSQPPPSHEQKQQLPADTSNYWVMPVDEIFFAVEETSSVSPPDLETRTLAQIYEDQGHVARALQVYQRLLTKFPHNEFYRHRVIKLTQLVKKSAANDPILDPAVITKMEHLDRIDFKLEKCRYFLHKLLAGGERAHYRS